MLKMLGDKAAGKKPSKPHASPSATAKSTIKKKQVQSSEDVPAHKEVSTIPSVNVVMTNEVIESIKQNSPQHHEEIKKVCKSVILGRMGLQVQTDIPVTELIRRAVDRLTVNFKAHPPSSTAAGNGDHNAHATITEFNNYIHDVSVVLFEMQRTIYVQALSEMLNVLGASSGKDTTERDQRDSIHTFMVWVFGDDDDSRLKKAKKDLAAEKKALEGAKKDLAALDNENKQLAGKLKKLGDDLDNQKQAAEAEAGDKDKALKELQDELGKEKDRADDAEGKAKKLQDALNNALGGKKQLGDKLGGLGKKMDDIIADMGNTLPVLEKETQDPESKLDHIGDEVKKLMGELADADKEKGRIPPLENELAKAQNELEATKAKIPVLLEKVRGLEAENRDCKEKGDQDAQALNNKAEDMANKLAKAEGDKKKLQEEIPRLQDEISKLKGAIPKAEALAKKNEELGNRLKNATDEVDGLKKKLAACTGAPKEDEPSKSDNPDSDSDVSNSDNEEPQQPNEEPSSSGEEGEPHSDSGPTSEPDSDSTNNEPPSDVDNGGGGNNQPDAASTDDDNTPNNGDDGKENPFKKMPEDVDNNNNPTQDTTPPAEEQHPPTDSDEDKNNNDQSGQDVPSDDEEHPNETPSSDDEGPAKEEEEPVVEQPNVEPDTTTQDDNNNPVPDTEPVKQPPTKKPTNPISTDDNKKPNKPNKKPNKPVIEEPKADTTPSGKPNIEPTTKPEEGGEKPVANGPKDSGRQFPDFNPLEDGLAVDKKAGAFTLNMVATTTDHEDPNPKRRWIPEEIYVYAMSASMIQKVNTPIHKLNGHKSAEEEQKHHIYDKMKLFATRTHSIKTARESATSHTRFFNQGNTQMTPEDKETWHKKNEEIGWDHFAGIRLDIPRTSASLSSTHGSSGSNDPRIKISNGDPITLDFHNRDDEQSVSVHAGGKHYVGLPASNHLDLSVNREVFVSVVGFWMRDGYRNMRDQGKRRGFVSLSMFRIPLDAVDSYDSQGPAVCKNECPPCDPKEEEKGGSKKHPKPNLHGETPQPHHETPKKPNISPESPFSTPTQQQHQQPHTKPDITPGTATHNQPPNTPPHNPSGQTTKSKLGNNPITIHHNESDTKYVPHDKAFHVDFLVGPHATHPSASKYHVDLDNIHVNLIRTAVHTEETIGDEVAKIVGRRSTRGAKLLPLKSHALRPGDTIRLVLYASTKTSNTLLWIPKEPTYSNGVLTCEVHTPQNLAFPMGSQIEADNNKIRYKNHQWNLDVEVTYKMENKTKHSVKPDGGQVHLKLTEDELKSIVWVEGAEGVKHSNIVAIYSNDNGLPVFKQLIVHGLGSGKSEIPEPQKKGLSIMNSLSGFFGGTKKDDDQEDIMTV